MPQPGCWEAVVLLGLGAVRQRASAVADVAPAGANVSTSSWAVLLLASLYPVFMDA